MNLRKSYALPQGGTIGVVNPSSPVESELLDSGIAVLKSRGFQIQVAPHVTDHYGHLAGRDADRAADLFQFYADPQIDVVWCARGGSSSCRLWPYLDWDALAALPPKMVIGYSDTTSLLIPLNQKVNVVSMHGPLVFELGSLPPELLDWQLRLLQSTNPAGEVPVKAAETLVPGTAMGRLCGGCLSLVVSTLGTRFQIDATGSLLLLEDIGEAPHRIERFLWQLGEAGILAQATGFVIGQATGADDTRTLPLRQIWADFLEPLGKPTVLGFPFGHVAHNYALPLGIRAELNANARTLTLLEAAVAESGF